MSIRAKIILGFTITLLASLVIGGYSVFTVNKITRMTEEHNDLAAARREVYNVLNAHYLWRQGLIVAVFGDSDFSGSLDPDTCALGQWLDDPEQQRMVNDSVRELLTVLEQPHDLIHTQAAETVQLLKEGRRDEAIAQYTNDIAPNAEKSIELLTQIAEQYSIMMESNSVSIHEFQIMALYIIIALIAAVTVIAVMLAVLIIKSVLKPIRRLAEVSEDIAKGRLNVNIDTAAKDETGMLARSFDNVRTVVDRLILDLEELGQKELEGEIDARIDASKYEGAYKEVTQVINQLIDSKNSDILRFLDFMKMFGKGDFDISLPPMPGKKVIMNEISDTFKNAINTIHREIVSMTKNASNGELSKTVDTASYSGKWAELVDDLNVLMQAMSAPIAEAAEVLGYVSRGDFGHKMQGNYKGEFLKIKDSINTTVTSIASYIGEISSVLTAISRNDLNQEITRDYVGSFSDIKNAMNNIIFTLNDIIGDIRAASDQVASESQMISQSSMVLASGSIEQSEAVEYLNTMIQSINESTAQNAENAFKAESFSGDSKQKASQGNEYMKDMLESMEGIKTSSGKITNIIKVIEDIAFQTNLLALNAAVEAARAGEHGKGFAVVASEVRTLAGRSQVAAKETTALIDESISKVGEGMRIAEKTAAALMSIVGGVEQEAGIITDIASGSKKQAEAIAKVTDSLSKITDVVQNNSSTSHETASASEELSGQAEAMRKLVGLFKLKSKLNPQV